MEKDQWALFEGASHRSFQKDKLQSTYMKGSENGELFRQLVIQPKLLQ